MFSKPYFEHAGLVVAWDAGAPLGFVHAGFGPTAERDRLDFASGVVSMLMVDPQAPGAAPAREALLDAGLAYLRGRGARCARVSSNFPYGPFYLGLYGGCQIPGLLDGDSRLIEFFTAAGFRLVERIEILQIKLAGFRPSFDRRQVVLRRQFRLQVDYDPEPKNWWDACTLGTTDRIRFTLVERAGGRSVGEVTFWDMVPLSRQWGVRAMGLFDLRIERAARKGGLATFLVNESMRAMQEQGVALVEAQVRENNLAARPLFEKMGYYRVDRGTQLERELTPVST